MKSANAVRAPAPVALDPGSKPRLDWLACARLAVNAAYQRDTTSRRSQALIARIAGNFRWAAFGAAVVAATGQGGHGYDVIDGQHRLAAARLAGLKTVPCVIIATAFAADAARAFVYANRDRVTVNVLHVHHAMRAAGDEVALRIQRVCARAGVTIARYPMPVENMHPGETMAVSTIAECVKTYGEEVVAEALRLLAEAYGDRPGGIRSTLIRGLSILRVPGDPELRARLIRVLRGLSAGALMDDIRDHKEAGKGGGSGQACATILRRRAGLDRPRAGEAGHVGLHVLRRRGGTRAGGGPHLPALPRQIGGGGVNFEHLPYLEGL